METHSLHCCLLHNLLCHKCRDFFTDDCIFVDKPYDFCFVLGELSEEEEVLQWLITQKTEERIELITRVMLEGLVEEIQYLAVYFCKYIVEKDVHADLLYLKNVCQIIDESCF